MLTRTSSASRPRWPCCRGGRVEPRPARPSQNEGISNCSRRRRSTRQSRMAPNKKKKKPSRTDVGLEVYRLESLGNVSKFIYDFWL